MKQLKILMIFSAIAVIIIIYNTNFASGNNAPKKIDSDALADIENAIIIKGIEAGADSPWHESDIDNLDGVIIYNDSFNNIKLKKDYSGKESYINTLRRQDNKWHLTRHKIKNGENLWTIAKNFDTDYKLIIKVNEISKPDRLNPGRTISIPNRIGITHKVVRFDTLSALSKKYGVRQEIIKTQNNIKSNIIKEGENLFIPDVVEHEEKIVKKPSSNKNVCYSHNKNDLKNSVSKRYDHQKKPANDNDNSRPEFMWPLKGEITSSFGKRHDPINNKLKFHCGLDIRAEIGTPIKASADGEAIFSGWKKGYGRVVVLKHKGGFITVYAHNKENIISSGEKVQKGEVIASSGMSGAVTGPHLHFEIRKFVTPLNPHRFLK